MGGLCAALVALRPAAFAPGSLCAWERGCASCTARRSFTALRGLATCSSQGGAADDQLPSQRRQRVPVVFARRLHGCSAVATAMQTSAGGSHYQDMTLPASGAAFVLSPALRPSHRRRPLTFAATLAFRRCQPPRENSVATLLSIVAGGEVLRSFAPALGMHCGASETSATGCASRLCPRMHPGQTASNGVTERRKGDRSCFHKKTRQQSSGTPAIQDLAFAKALPVVC